MDYAKEMMKETDMAGSPTLPQAAIPLAWLCLHQKGQDRTHRNPLAESRERKRCSQPGLVEKQKTRTRGSSTWLFIGGLVPVPHVVERGRKTIKQATAELCDMATTYIQKPHLWPRGFAATKERWKATIAGIVHDMMAHSQWSRW